MAEKTYDWWHSAIEALRNGNKLPNITEDPEYGFYRIKKIKGGPWLPVCIDADGVSVGFCDDSGEFYRDGTSIWMSAATHPVSYEAYIAAFESGVWWSDVLATEAQKHDIPEAPLGEVTQEGSNSQAMGVGEIELTPQEEAEKAVANAIRDANQFAQRIGSRELSGKTEADEAADIVQAIKATVNDAAKVHKELKAPYLRAGQELDAWLREVKVDAEKASQKLTSKVTAYLVAERKRQEEELRKAQEEAKAKAEAERKRLEAERAAQLEVEESATPEKIIDWQAPIVIEPEPVKAPEPIKAGGGVGKRSIGLQTKERVIIDDYAKALEAAANEPEVREAVQAVANRMLKGKVILAGCHKEEYMEARR